MVESADDAALARYCIRVHGHLKIVTLADFVLRQVDGSVNITGNTLLQSLQGPSVWSVGGTLSVTNNAVARTDGDVDGTYDDSDNCVWVFNPTQVDTDHNGIGDACDCTPTNPCLNGGTCVLVDRVAVCMCTFEYTGAFCNVSVPVPQPAFYASSPHTFFFPANSGGAVAQLA